MVVSQAALFAFSSCGPVATRRLVSTQMAESLTRQAKGVPTSHHESCQIMASSEAAALWMMKV